MILLHAELLARQADHVSGAVYVLLIVSVFDKIILARQQSFDLFRHPAGCGLQAERHAQLIEFFMNQVKAMLEFLFFLGKWRKEEKVLAMSCTDEKNIILNSPGRVVRLLPDEKRIECAVDLLIMVNAEESVDHFLIFYAKRMKFYDAHLLINLFCIHCFVYI